MRRWSGRKDLRAADDGLAGLGAFSLGGGFGLGNLLLQEGGEVILGHVLAARWSMDGQFDGGRAGAVRPEVARGAGDVQPLAPDGRPQRRRSWPVMGAHNQVSGSRVRQGVNDLGQHVLRVDQFDNRGLLRGPEVLPSAAKGVLVLGEKLVEALEELWKVAVPVDDDAMPVVGHGDERDDVDTRSLRREAKAVEEGVVGGLVGPEQEGSLGAAPCDEVGAARNDLSGTRHARLSALEVALVAFLAAALERVAARAPVQHSGGRQLTTR
jgi:hypothetical protein